MQSADPLDMANAPSFAAAQELLSGSDYALPAPVETFGPIEELLLQRRAEVRELFISLMLDEPLVELLRARHDFANMRLAIRRVVTDRPIGTGYSDFGSVPADQFEEAFRSENYGQFPLYLQEAIEEAVLAYADVRCPALLRVVTPDRAGPG